MGCEEGRVPLPWGRGPDRVDRFVDRELIDLAYDPRRVDAIGRSRTRKGNGMNGPKASGAWWGLLCATLIVGCDDGGNVLGPDDDSSDLPVVAGVYSGRMETTRFSCLNPVEFADASAAVEQGGDRITIETDDGIRVEGRVFESGAFWATGEAVAADFTGRTEVRMFGRFGVTPGGTPRLLATRMLTGSIGAAVCETTQNFRLLERSNF